MNLAAVLTSDDTWLETLAAEGKLYAFVDPFFEMAVPVETAQLEARDTDPVFYEAIAWDQVTYEPAVVTRITPEALRWIRNSLSTERWGVFFKSSASLESLARHFQRFVIARGPDSNPYFLRFHDASVLQVLLATWGAKEKSIFFGPVSAFGIPDLDTMSVRMEECPFGERERFWPLPEDCLIQLRESQLRLCGEAIDRDLVKVIHWYLRNHHSRSVQYLDKPVLEDRVRYAISRARRYRLGSVSDLAGFAALMMELAPNFDEHPSFRKVLEDPKIPPEAKLKRLSQVISDREWEEVLQSYDRTFWPSVLKTRKPAR